ncbi:hypothetical protein Bca101_020041 [Brassica carinata]
MITDTDNAQKMRDNVDTTVEKTLAANTNTVTADANTAALEQMKEMFASSQKRSGEQNKLMGSLTKQVKTLTVRTRSILPRGATRVCSGRRIIFKTPLDGAVNARKNSSK